MRDRRPRNRFRPLAQSRSMTGHAGIEPLEQRFMLASGDFAWAFKFGGIEENDAGRSVATDSAGNIYLAAVFHGTTDVDPGPRRRLLTSTDDSDDVFLAKYDRAGRLKWVQQLSSHDDDVALKVAVGPASAVYLIGVIDGPATFIGPGKPLTLKSHGQHDGFIARFKSTTGQAMWTGHVGGELDDTTLSVTPGPANQLFLSGTIRITGNMDPTGNASGQITTRGVDDTFVESIDARSGRVLWSKVYGENDTMEPATGLVPDGQGGVFVGGYFMNTVQFDRANRAWDRTSEGDNDIYIGHINARGKWTFLNTIGADNQDYLYAMATGGPQGDLYITGVFNKTVNFGPTTLEASDDNAPYVARVNRRGQVRWVGQFALLEDASVTPHDIAVDRAGSVYTTGEFYGDVSFDPASTTGPGVLTTDKGGDATALKGQQEATDTYISKLDANGNFVYVKQIGGHDGTIVGNGIAVDRAGGVYVTGVFNQRVDLNPGRGTHIVTTHEDDETDGFLLHLKP